MVMYLLRQFLPYHHSQVEQGEKTIDDKYSEYSIRSGFARLNYSFMDRYLLELNGRYDGSSKFPKSHRFGFFPSVSVGWRLGQEAFMNWSRSWLDDFKVRASYGSVGNQRISPYQFSPVMSLHSMVLTSWMLKEKPLTSLLRAW